MRAARNLAATHRRVKYCAADIVAMWRSSWLEKLSVGNRRVQMQSDRSKSADRTPVSKAGKFLGAIVLTSQIWGLAIVLAVWVIQNCLMR